MEEVTLTPAGSAPSEHPMSTAVEPKLLTAEEYFELPDDGLRTELVRGVVVPRNMPAPSSEGFVSSTSAVIEVVSPLNTRRQIAVKTGEYLNAGVNVVCVVDPAYKTVNLHFPDEPTKELEGENLLTFVDLPGFSQPVSKFFD